MPFPELGIAKKTYTMLVDDKINQIDINPIEIEKQLVCQEGKMTIKIISKRSFQMDEKKKLIPLFAKLRSLSKQHPGHIYREILRSLDNPGEYIVISKWEEIEDWKQWLNDKEIRDIQGKIDSIIGEKTIYEVYETETF
jgi:heme-degrading monooxygenase HmoA